MITREKLIESFDKERTVELETELDSALKANGLPCTFYCHDYPAEVVESVAKRYHTEGDYGVIVVWAESPNGHKKDRYVELHDKNAFDLSDMTHAKRLEYIAKSTKVTSCGRVFIRNHYIGKLTDFMSEYQSRRVPVGFKWKNETKDGTIEAMAKIETAAKSLEQAATAIKSEGHASIIPSQESTVQRANRTHSFDRPISSPKELQDEVELTKKSEHATNERRERENLTAFRTNVRRYIQRRLFEELYHRHTLCVELAFRYEPPMDRILDASGKFRDDSTPAIDQDGVFPSFPWDMKSYSVFLEVIEEFKRGGWECKVGMGYGTDRRSPVGFDRLTLKINPSST